MSPSWGNGQSVPVGTLRVQQLSDPTIAKIGRVAVMKPHRSQGIARRLFLVGEDVVRSMGITQCVLDSQADKKAVYEKLGYRVLFNGNHKSQNQAEELGTSDDIESGLIDGSRKGEFLLDGAWHIKMHKNLLPTA